MRKEALVEGYAQAVYETATDGWLKALSRLNDALAAKPEVMIELTDPGRALADKEAIASRILPSDTTQPVRNLVSTLLSRNDLALLPAIVAEFRRMVAHRAGLTRGIVTSAVPLTDDEKAGLVQVLTAQFGADLDIEYVVDPSLIGGVIVRVGDRVIDGSVAHKLDLIRGQLAQTR